MLNIFYELVQWVISSPSGVSSEKLEVIALYVFLLTKSGKKNSVCNPNWIPAMSNADKINSPKVVALFGCLQIILLRFNHKWWLHCLAFYPTVFGMNSNKDSPVSNIQHNHNSNGLNCINTNREREVPFHSYLGSCLVPRPLKVMSIKATVLHVNAQLEGHLPHYGTTSMDVHTHSVQAKLQETRHSHSWFSENK